MSEHTAKADLATHAAERLQKLQQMAKQRQLDDSSDDGMEEEEEAAAAFAMLAGGTRALRWPGWPGSSWLASSDLTVPAA